MTFDVTQAAIDTVEAVLRQNAQMLGEDQAIHASADEDGSIILVDLAGRTRLNLGNADRAVSHAERAFLRCAAKVHGTVAL